MSMQAEEKITFNTFDPDIIFQSLNANDWYGCWDYIRLFIESFSKKLNMGGAMTVHAEMEDAERRKYAQEFGALAAELMYGLLLTPNMTLPDKLYYRIIFCHEIVHDLFKLHGGLDTDAAVEGLLEGNKKKLSGTEQKAITILLSMNTKLDIIPILRRLDIKYRAHAICAYLGWGKIYEKTVYYNKLKLYELRKDIENAEPDPNMIKTACSIFFLCSYIDTLDKHLLKDNVNRLMQKLLSTLARPFRQIRELPVEPIGGIDLDKPRILIVMELFSRGHAMYRSWGEWMKSLENQFNVLILVEERQFDEVHKEHYKLYQTFSNIGEVVKIAHNYKPDMLILPSVGMSFWGISAANMRLAPIQLMGLGHPATTRSPHIDYVYGQSHLYHPDAFPTDTYIADDASYKFIPLLNKEQVMLYKPVSHQATDARILKVTVVGSELKICAPFIELLQDIERESDFEIHFSFNIGTMSLEMIHMQEYISRQFKHVKFYGWQSYIDYMHSLKDADIVLNPFPFGHTNTVIDTLLLGKPCIGLEGTEPSARTEKYVLDTVGLADQFVAKDIQDYKQKFKGLAEKILRGETHFFDREEIYDKLYDTGKEVKTDFSKTVKWIYDNHRKIKDSKKKMVTAFEDLG